jgi:hypothetical protein
MTQIVDPVLLAKRRRVAFGVLFVVVLVITGAHLREGVAQHGVSAEAIVPPVATLVLVAGIFAGVLHWTRRAEAQAGGTTPEARARRTKVFVALGVGGASLSALATVLSNLTATPPAPPRFHREDSRVTSVPLGLALTVPPSWEPVAVDAQPGMDFALQHPASGTFFAGYGLVAERAEDDLDATLRAVLEGRRDKWGQLFDEEWGNEAVGRARTRTLSLTVQRSDGRVRTKLWLGREGPYRVGFNCSGPEATFAESAKQCRDLLDRFETRP